ncbi:MAG: bifunctional hydroxymethylpyrimidine kinase/phosphomethylpyrimidine kinase [Bryobacterales bacterium]|nr:bifunctional hydroxymethylpyrimidine kinase/phosphomethylpyrimidine kinase [Bryobacterales bacterium]
MQAVALTIAGSDPSGGAGIQADLKTFHQFGVYGEAVLTLLTVQNTLGVERVECLSPELVLEQLRAVLADIPPGAAKTGALGNREVVIAVGEAARDFDFPLVVDPVMISKHGAALLSSDAVAAVKTCLAPRAFLLTPNLAEASVLSGIEVRNIPDMREAARRIGDLGPEAVLVKGGHLPGTATDVLYWRGEFSDLSGERVETRHTHGTGCTYSAAIAAELARGTPLDEAVFRAKAYIGEAIRSGPGLGRGSGPVNHHATAALGRGKS